MEKWAIIVSLGAVIIAVVGYATYIFGIVLLTIGRAVIGRLPIQSGIIYEPDRPVRAKEPIFGPGLWPTIVSVVYLIVLWKIFDAIFRPIVHPLVGKAVFWLFALFI